MRILGIDPGLQTTGFGVIDVDGHRLSYVASGTIRTTALALGDLPGRLKVLFDGISEVAARYQPDVATVEIVFVNVNPQSTLLLGQARGAAITGPAARAAAGCSWHGPSGRRCRRPAAACQPGTGRPWRPGSCA
jgi:crossover junction endodeoxyribonuclease RuvC